MNNFTKTLSFYENKIWVCTYSPKSALTINVARVDAHNEMYVLITARC